MPRLTVPEIQRLPGFLLRRCNQSFMAIFLHETAGLDLTPAQFGALASIAAEPGMDQTRLTDRLALDRSSVTKSIERLEGRGLIRREIHPADKRARLLFVSAEGEALLDATAAAVARAQAAIIEPLGPERGALFLDMLGEVATAHNEVSRVPLRNAPEA